MVCDKIIYKGQTCLTLYHQGFDDMMPRRKVKKVEKVGRYNLMFCESFVDNSEIENIKDWEFREEGLLEPDSSKNPYSYTCCAHMIHYSYANKPSNIFKLSEQKYCLKISVDDFVHINEFVRKYIGIDMEANPMYYGDIFIFKYNGLNYRSNKGDGIIVENAPSNSTIIVHFRRIILLFQVK